jgi:hypothetical protein
MLLQSIKDIEVLDLGADTHTTRKIDNKAKINDAKSVATNNTAAISVVGPLGELDGDDLNLSAGDIPMPRFGNSTLADEGEDDMLLNSSSKAIRIKHIRMSRRGKRVICLFYPEDTYKANWDLCITLVLIFTCMVTPYNISFNEVETNGWKIVNGVIDTLFLIDIICSFFQSYYDEDFGIIEDRWEIAKSYLYSWFLVDVLAIFPFEQVLTSANSGANLNDMVRVARIGRMYKLIKLTKLLRILKIVKERSKLVKYVNEILKVGAGFERLFFFVLMFLMVCHIVSCLWVFFGRLDAEGSWL